MIVAARGANAFPPLACYQLYGKINAGFRASLSAAGAMLSPA
jgi:hypothetical protein